MEAAPPNERWEVSRLPRCRRGLETEAKDWIEREALPPLPPSKNELSIPSCVFFPKAATRMSNLSEKSEPEDTEPLLLGNGNIFRGASRDLTREEAQGGNNVLGPGDVVLDRALWGECLDMAGIAGPTALGNLLEYLPVCTAMAIVGRLPGEEGKVRTILCSSPPSRPITSRWRLTAFRLFLQMGLDAISLGRAYFNITAIAPVFGIVSCPCPLCYGLLLPRGLTA